MMTNGNLKDIVGNDNVIVDTSVLSGFHSNYSFLDGEEPACVVRPTTSEQIQEIVRHANQEGIPLIPVSSQEPRFRGDTIPSQAGAVMVDLSNMDKIVRIDRRSKTALIEPGVTFSSLLAAAGKEGLRVATPLMPRSTKSVVASMLEREPTTLPRYHWDMQDPLCCIEIIFGTGDLFRTGSAAGPGTLEQQWASGQAQKSPMGPAQADFAKIIQGAQGTMGIVTWTSVKLEIKPALEKAFFVTAEKLQDLLDFTYRLTYTRYADHCFIINSTDLEAILGKAVSDNLPQWILLYSISGLERFPQDRVHYIESDIADLARDMRIEPHRAIGTIDADDLCKRISRPGEDPYWKVRKKGSFQDLIFINTLDRAPEFVKTIKEEAQSYGFDYEDIGIYFQPIQQGRNCHMEFTLMFDPANGEEVKHAKEFFLGAIKTCIGMGGFVSRPYEPITDLVYERCPDTVAALKKVKNILDPNNVMNPGKLCFR